MWHGEMKIKKTPSVWPKEDAALIREAAIIQYNIQDIGFRILATGYRIQDTMKWQDTNDMCLLVTLSLFTRDIDQWRKDPSMTPILWPTYR